MSRQEVDIMYPYYDDKSIELRKLGYEANRQRVHDLMDNTQSVIKAAVFTKLKGVIAAPLIKAAQYVTSAAYS